MKTLLIACSVALLMPLQSCKKADDSLPAPAATAADLKTIVPAGSWSVRLYRQRTEDKTSSFAGIRFVFSPDGSVVATDKGKTTKGTWSSTPGGITYYGSAPTIATMTLLLGSEKPYDRISKTWNVNAGTGSANLKLDNKEPADDEHLEFVR